MTVLQVLILFFSAMLGGTLNSVAGGGSFFTFPALLFMGVLPIQANATSTLSIWAAGAASIGAYRRELGALNRVLVVVLTGSSLIGGVLGALLLLRTPASTFVTVLPYLLFVATVLFMFSRSIAKSLHVSNRGKDQVLSIKRLLWLTVSQFLIAIYGGYFGGGMGVLILATLSMSGIHDIHLQLSLKMFLGVCINGVAVITFVLLGMVVWPQAIVMIVGATIGGYGGAYYARKVDQKKIRIFVIIVSVGLTGYFFLRIPVVLSFLLVNQQTLLIVAFAGDVIFLLVLILAYCVRRTLW